MINRQEVALSLYNKKKNVCIEFYNTISTLQSLRDTINSVKQHELNNSLEVFQQGMAGQSRVLGYCNSRFFAEVTLTSLLYSLGIISSFNLLFSLMLSEVIIN